MRLNRIKGKFLTAGRIIKTRGILETSIFTLQKVQARQARKATPGHAHAHKGKQITSMAALDDILAADWTVAKTNQKGSAKSKPKKPYTINWVMSPPGRGSGGHQNIFRFIKYLESAGHTCNIYLYSTSHFPTVSEIKQILKESYPKTVASIQWLKKSAMAPADAIVATGWETAYPVYSAGTKSTKKFYFVQDFEPRFYPMGTDYVLAENSYRFGFYGITAGGWLADMLHKDFGMETDHFDFGADTNVYHFSNEQPRKEIFFYARPVTARRGFELGVMALDLFAKEHPDYTINLAGWDVSDYNLPFKAKNLGSVNIEELSDIYNRCSAALVLSLTNMSLLPLELLACGTIPVVNDGANNRLVSNNPYIAYSQNSPAALARKLSEIVTRKDQVAYARKAAASVQAADWDVSGKKFVNIIEREIARG